MKTSFFIQFFLFLFLNLNDSLRIVFLVYHQINVKLDMYSITIHVIENVSYD